MQQKMSSHDMDKIKAIEAVKRDGYALRDLPQYKDDIDVVLAAVSAEGGAMQFASPRLKAHDDVVIKAVTQDAYAINFIDPSFKLNRKFALFFFSLPGRGFNFNWFGPRLQANKNVAIAAVSSSGMSLSQMEGFQNDKKVVAAAVADSAIALCYASESLRDNKDFVLQVVRSNGLALEYASPFLRSDQHIVAAAIRQNGLALEYAADGYKFIRQVVTIAVNQNGLAIRHIRGVLRYCRNLNVLAVKRNGLALADLMPGYKKDKPTVLAAVRQNGLALFHMDSSLESDLDIALAAVRQNPEALRFVSNDLKRNLKVISAAIIGQNIDALQYVPGPLRGQISEILQGVRNEETSTILANIAGDAKFQGFTTNFSEPLKLLLRESKLASMFFDKRGLYMSARLFMQVAAKALIDGRFVANACVNTVLEFLFPQNLSGCIMALGATKEETVNYEPSALLTASAALSSISIDRDLAEQQESGKRCRTLGS